MTTRHTPEPFDVAGMAIYAGNVKIAQCLDIESEEIFGTAIMPRLEWRDLLPDGDTAVANAARIVACVNFCAGMDMAEMVRDFNNLGDMMLHGMALADETATLQRERDAMRAALDEMVVVAEHMRNVDVDSERGHYRSDRTEAQLNVGSACVRASAALAKVRA